MAGMEDNCPKCGARIRAPIPESDPTADPKPASAAEAAPGKSRHGVLDAVLHAPEHAGRVPRTTLSQESAGVPKEREASRPTLFDEFLSSAPQPPREEVAAEAPSEKPPKLRLKPLKAATPVRGPEIETPPPAPPTIPPVLESDPAAPPVPPTLLEIISAAGPKPVTPPPEPADELQPSEPASEPPEGNQPDFGMGEMIAEQSNSPSPAVTRRVIPSLGVGLMQIEDRPRQHRVRRRHRAIITGVLLFLLFDAAVFCWIFRHRIFEWWHERHPVAVAQRTAAPPVKPAATPATAASGKDPGRPLTTPPPAQPTVEPEEPIPALIPRAPLPAKTPDAQALADPRPASPSVAATPGAQPEPSPREVGEIPGKKEFSAAQIGPPVVPSSATTDPPKGPLMTPATRELLTPLDVPLLITPKPSETLAVASGNDLKAKIEMTPPPSPTSLPLVAPIPEATEKPTTPEPAPGLPVTADSDVSPAPAKIVESGVIAASRPALAALKSFLAAPTWQERLRWAQKPDTVKAAMEKHYRKHPDGPVNVARIDFIERYPARSGNPPYCMFEVRGGDLKRSILVLVEEKSKADIRVDWEAFVEFKDQLLREFLGKPGASPGKFRVMIRRKPLLRQGPCPTWTGRMHSSSASPGST